MSEKVKKSGCLQRLLVPGMFIVFPAIGCLVASVISSNQPILYQSRAVVELLPISEKQSPSAHDTFMDTKLEAMRSSGVYSMVSGKIQAETRWNMQQEDAVAAIRKSTSIQRLGNSRMLEITVQHEEQTDAKTLAESIYQVYQEREKQLTRNQQKHRLNVLQDEAQNLKDRQAEFRKRYMDVREKLMHGRETEYDPKVKYDAQSERIQQELDYAKEEFEAARAQSRAADEKVANLKFSMAAPQDLLVVHTAPEIALNPVSPDAREYRIKGLVIGALVAFICVIFVYLNRLITAISSRT